jgi:survival-of-motor-neuron-related-splicing factor 30
MDSEIPDTIDNADNNDNDIVIDKPAETGDYTDLIEHYKKLLEYKNNLFKIDTLLAIEKEEETQDELSKLRGDLLQAISYQEDVIRFTQGHDDFTFNADRLVNEDTDRLARCYFKQENKWYLAKIDSVDIDTQEAEVTFLGFKDKIKLDGVNIKIVPAPDPTNFEPGTYCEAIYSGDGKYYPCVIEKIIEGNYQVKFRKYNNKEIVSLYYLRPLDNPDSGDKNKQALLDEVKELKIPDHLKILPNDSEAQRKSKKKKIKALKASWKMAQIEKDSKEKQDKWSSFANKTEVISKKGSYKGESIFRSPDTVEGKVGVMGSGKGMTNFNPKTKFSLGDSSHLSRLF